MGVAGHVELGHHFDVMRSGVAQEPLELLDAVELGHFFAVAVAVVLLWWLMLWLCCVQLACMDHLELLPGPEPSMDMRQSFSPTSCPLHAPTCP